MNNVLDSYQKSNSASLDKVTALAEAGSTVDAKTMVECIKALRAELVEKFISADSFDELKGEFKTMNDLVTKKMDTKITEIEESVISVKTDLEEKTQDLYRIVN